MSNIVEKVKAKIDNVLHKDETPGHNTTGTHHTHHQHHETSTYPTATHAAPLSSTTGTNQPIHSSNIANKLDPRVDTDNTHNIGGATYGTTGSNTTDYGHQRTGLGGTHNYPQQSSTVGGYGTAPPVHDSNVLNKLDPRVDSTQVPNTTGYPNQQSGIGGGYGTTGSHQTTTAGPHDSNLLNKLDPRVDSDRDGSHNLGAATYGPGGATNTNTLGGQHAGYGTGSHQTTTAGPHDSNLLNKLDPRVDSDRDGSHNLGAATYGPGGASNPSTLGGQNVGGYGNAPPVHNSSVLNKLDPRVPDVGSAYNTTTGTGTAYNTNTGPVHDSKLLNKLDPRVDSDVANSNLPGSAAHGLHHNPNTTY